jgi:hypothetical protein
MLILFRKGSFEEENIKLGNIHFVGNNDKLNSILVIVHKEGDCSISFKFNNETMKCIKNMDIMKNSMISISSSFEKIQENFFEGAIVYSEEFRIFICSIQIRISGKDIKILSTCKSNPILIGNQPKIKLIKTNSDLKMYEKQISNSHKYDFEQQWIWFQ